MNVASRRPTMKFDGTSYDADRAGGEGHTAKPSIWRKAGRAGALGQTAGGKCVRAPVIAASNAAKLTRRPPANHREPVPGIGRRSGAEVTDPVLARRKRAIAATGPP